jgi:AraC-like DNA-binding protein
MREGDFGVRRPWRVGQRRILDYLLFWVRSGECEVEADGRQLRLRAGDWCFVQPRTLLTLRAETETITPFAHFDLFYNPRREEGFPAPPGLLDLSNYAHLVQPRLDDLTGARIPIHLKPANAAWLRETFLKAVGAWQNRDVLSQLETQNRLSDIALSILRETIAEQAPGPAAPRDLDWLTSYLMLHLGEAISVEDMARRAGLSPSRFAAAFRAHFGMAPHRYLTHLRLAHAQELLRNSRSTLVEIAGYCGFADVHHFSKIFKLHTGQAPGAFRGR